jgi:hypothetical protein
MSKRVFILAHDTARRLASKLVQDAPQGTQVTFSDPTRNLDQNAKFHAICHALSQSDLQWAGKVRSAEQWKVLLVSGHTKATEGEVEIVPGLEGEFINIRESTALMSKKRASSLIEYALAFCVLNDIICDVEFECLRKRGLNV